MPAVAALHALAARAGRCHGTRTRQDPTTNAAEASPSTLQATPVFGGRFVPCARA